MRKIQFSAAKALAMLVIITILGGVGGAILYDVTEYRLPGGQWQPVSLGGEKAARILGQDRKSGDIFIQTSEGNAYACDADSCSIAQVPQGLTTSAEQRYNPPPPPANVIDSLTVPPPIYGFCSGQINFVILADGSVWRWYKVGCCEMGCFIVVVYPLAGGALGFVASVAMIIVWRRRSQTVTGIRSTRLSTLGKLCLFVGVIALAVLICNMQINLLRIEASLARSVVWISAGLIGLGVIQLVVARLSKGKNGGEPL